jgi:hypothetical protein
MVFGKSLILLFWSRLLLPARDDESLPTKIPQPVTLVLSMATSLAALNVI